MEGGDKWYSVISSVVCSATLQNLSLDLADARSFPLLMRSFEYPRASKAAAKMETFFSLVP